MTDIDYMAMDEAAAQAGKELMQLGMEATVAQIADWWRRWYMKAGHKRLARILMGVKCGSRYCNISSCPVLNQEQCPIRQRQEIHYESSRNQTSDSARDYSS